MLDFPQNNHFVESQETAVTKVVALMNWAEVFEKYFVYQLFMRVEDFMSHRVALAKYVQFPQ